MLSPPPLMVTCIILFFLPISFLTLLSRYPLSLPSPPPHIPRFPCLPDPVLLHLAAGSTAASDDTKHPKLAFLFLTTTPLPFAPLWDRFFSDASHLFNIYIHADPSQPYSQPFSGVFAGKVIPSAPTSRSHPSLIAAARRLLAHALLHDPANSMFALLSPSCVPLRPFSAVYRHLSGSRSPAKSYIEILSSEPSMPVRYAARGPGSMLPDVPFERFRVGSQFFILNRKHALLVVNDTVLWDHFRRPCDSPDTCYPEEHYFSTMLSMADPHGCVPATLTNVDWTGRADGHPRTYEPHEVEPELIKGLRSARPRYGEWADRNRSDPFLFARKFSPGCLEPLMNLADEVLFKG